jgi:Flp pilus assembly pilin Flp
MWSRFRTNIRGAGAVEFALITPALFMMIIGIAQFGTMYFAKAGLSHAVAEASRIAAIHPRPNNSEIQARLTKERFGLRADRLGTPTIVSGRVDNADFLDITMTYTVPMNFVIVKPAPVVLRERRRVFVYPLDAN